MGTPQQILEAPFEALQQVKNIGPAIARSICNWKNLINVEAELHEVKRHGVSVICQEDATYPEALKQIHDPPPVLYILGQFIEKDNHSIGVVGTRKPSSYAAECAKKLSFQLAYAGFTVVSGLARGVDTWAHQGALAAQGRTIAVIGSGLAKLYPPENLELAKRIADCGAVVSEFPMTTQADRQTFPMRNRIISGCTLGLLVIEAGSRSGALITASQAIEHGRSVFAVPGRIDNPNAFGSNQLIQQGAKLTQSIDDILDDIQPRSPELFSYQRAAAASTDQTPVCSQKSAVSNMPHLADLSQTEHIIYESLGIEELTPDEIIAKSGLPSHQVSSTLLALEIRRLVKQLPGNRFVKSIG